jgi:hypothetical protein
VLHLTEEEFSNLPLGAEPETIDAMLKADSPLPAGLSSSDTAQLMVLKTKFKGISRKQAEGDLICDMQQILQFLEGDTMGQKKEICLFIMYVQNRTISTQAGSR